MASPNRLKFSFGFAVIVIGLLQIGCQIGVEISTVVFDSHDTAEDYFKSGAWLGGFDMLLGMILIASWYFQSSRCLHYIAIITNALIIALGIAYLALRAHWYVNDPTYGDLFSDCLQWYWPQTYMWNQPPHCSAQAIKQVLAPVMMALCTLKILICIAGVVLFRFTPRKKVEVARTNF